MDRKEGEHPARPLERRLLRALDLPPEVQAVPLRLVGSPDVHHEGHHGVLGLHLVQQDVGHLGDRAPHGQPQGLHDVEGPHGRHVGIGHGRAQLVQGLLEGGELELFQPLAPDHHGEGEASQVLLHEAVEPRHALQLGQKSGQDLPLVQELGPLQQSLHHPLDRLH